jgi:hypothetical protein
METREQEYKLTFLKCKTIASRYSSRFSYDYLHFSYLSIIEHPKAPLSQDAKRCSIMGTRSRQQPSSVSCYATARRFPRTNEKVSSWSDLGFGGY